MTGNAQVDHRKYVKLFYVDHRRCQFESLQGVSCSYIYLMLLRILGKNTESCNTDHHDIYIRHKKKCTIKIFPLSSPFNAKVLIVTKYFFLINPYKNSNAA